MSVSITGRHVKVTALTKVVPYALVVALYLVGVLTISGYSSRSAVTSLLVLASLLGIASIGQTFALLIGGIDLSIPSVIGLADVAISRLYGDGWSFFLAALVILLVAAVVGIVNGALSIALRVHPLVITLGVGSIVLGGVLTWTEGLTVGNVPSWLVRWVSSAGKVGTLPVPPVVLVWAVLALAVLGFQLRTRLGRETYAVGSNIVAARLALVRTTRVWIVTYVISAVLAAVTGILLAGFSGAGDSSVGQPYLLQTITAAVVGGTSLLGGRGGYGRTIVGVLIITQLTTLLVGANLDLNMQEACLGLLVIVLVALYGRQSHVSTEI